MTTTPAVFPIWDETFSVGVAELDEQHRALFRVLAVLADVLAGGGDADAVQAELEELLGDCSTHFTAEEEYLERSGYPGTMKQRVQHRLFVGRLSALVDRVRGGEEPFGEETLDGLSSWLRGHILGLDREYAEYLGARRR